MRPEPGGRRGQADALVARLHQQLIGDSVTGHDEASISAIAREQHPLLAEDAVAEVVEQLPQLPQGGLREVGDTQLVAGVDLDTVGPQPRRGRQRLAQR